MFDTIFRKEPPLYVREFGGGSGGGGGSTGTVDYPSYMKDFHNALLDHTGADSPTNSVIDSMNALFGNSPYTGEVAYNPDTDITAMETATSTLSTAIVALLFSSDYEEMVDTAVAKYDATIDPAARITAKIEAYTDDLENALNTKLLPNFRSGMRNMGSVMTSAFTIGESILTEQIVREVAKLSSDLYLKVEEMRSQHIAAAMDLMAKMLLQKTELQRALAALTIEQKRLKIVAKDEEEKRNMELDALDAKWDLELFQYGSNVLAGVSGGVGTPNKDARSATANALGGAMSGAAAGAMIAYASQGAISGPWGMAAGAAVGLAASFIK